MQPALCGGQRSKRSTWIHTHWEDYINTQEEKREKQRCTSMQLSDWPKGFTLNVSLRDGECRERRRETGSE